MKFLELNAIIMKINKFQLFQCQIHENHIILKIPFQNQEKHENIIIQLQNHENHENLRIHN